MPTGQGAFNLLLNKQQIAAPEGYIVTFQEKFSLGKKEIVVMAVNSGGMACPMELFIVEMTSSSASTVSESFGTCSDLYKASLEKDSVIIRMPNYFNPMYLDSP